MQATGGREDNLALLAKDVRELVEDLMEQVGSSTDAKAGLVELKDVAQKFKASTPANPRIGHKTTANRRSPTVKSVPSPT